MTSLDYLKPLKNFNPRSRTGSDRQCGNRHKRRNAFQSTLPARGATTYACAPQRMQWISIHAPRTGSDRIDFPVTHTGRAFQSTLPARGATRQRVTPPNAKGISIHAPRTGSDHMKTPVGNADGYFNPRSPHGERRFAFSNMARTVISIHAPRTGSDKNFESVLFVQM